VPENSQTAARPAVSVVIPARDAAPTLERTLSCLLRQDVGESFEILVVDDGSTDETPAIAERHAPAVTLIRSVRSDGPGGARNRGASVARAPVLAFTDADCFPTPGWVRLGLQRMREGGLDVLQGAVSPDPQARREPFDRTVTVEQEVGFYPTANLFVQRGLFDELGGFSDWLLDEQVRGARSRFQPADRRRARVARTPIGEDTLFVWRGRRQGARVGFAAEALVHHAVVGGRLWDEVLDRWHWSRDMPGMARLVPELRDGCFYRHWFFSAKTARLDVALVAVLGAVVTGRRWMAWGAYPYAEWLAIEGARWGARDGVRHVAGSVITDAVTLAGLGAGSVAWRSLLL
jgi:glycosyltransferase involved in cell wall biosynthesis